MSPELLQACRQLHHLKRAGLPYQEILARVRVLAWTHEEARQAEILTGCEGADEIASLRGDFLHKIEPFISSYGEDTFEEDMLDVLAAGNLFYENFRSLILSWQPTVGDKIDVDKICHFLSLSPEEQHDEEHDIGYLIDKSPGLYSVFRNAIDATYDEIRIKMNEEDDFYRSVAEKCNYYGRDEDSALHRDISREIQERNRREPLLTRTNHGVQNFYEDGPDDF